MRMLELNRWFMRSGGLRDEHTDFASLWAFNDHFTSMYIKQSETEPACPKLMLWLPNDAALSSYQLRRAVDSRLIG
jgi:hypothetical protein